jgi:hypothetical protein
MTIRPAEELAQAMIGEPNSRFRVPTPALILDVAALDANIRRMAERSATRSRCARTPRRTNAPGSPESRSLLAQ